MAMDAVAIAQLIYDIGSDLVHRCSLVKQCESEATRISERVVEVMGSLEAASSVFSGNVRLGNSLMRLKTTMERARQLVESCQNPRSYLGRMTALPGANDKKGQLVEVEAELQRIMDGLIIPMLTDIRRHQQGNDPGGGERKEPGTTSRATPGLTSHSSPPRPHGERLPGMIASTATMRDGTKITGLMPNLQNHFTPDEREALMSFHRLSQPPGSRWRRSAGWGSSRESWSGVTVEYSRFYVTAIALPDNNLAGRISERLSDLIGLERLSLGENYLSGPIPRSLGSLSYLRILDLHDNCLQGSIPKEIGKLTALTCLNLDSNKFSGSIPKELGGLTALKFLILSDNSLSGSIPRELGRLSALEELHLDGNRFSGWNKKKYLREILPSCTIINV